MCVDGYTTDTKYVYAERSHSPSSSNMWCAPLCAHAVSRCLSNSVRTRTHTMAPQHHVLEYVLTRMSASFFMFVSSCFVSFADPRLAPVQQCSIQPNATSGAKDCPGKVDIVIVIDMSGSVQPAGCKSNPNDPSRCPYRAEKDFARSLLAPFKINPMYARVAVVYFNSKAVLSLGFNDDPTQIAFAIDKQQGSGGTAMYEGLGVAQKELKANGRVGVSKLVVLITDGSDNSNPGFSEAKAKELKTELIGGNTTHVITVGFTNGVNPPVLKRIASHPVTNETTKPKGKVCAVGAGKNRDNACSADPTKLDLYDNQMCEGVGANGNCQAKDYYFSPTAQKLKEITQRLASTACKAIVVVYCDPDYPPPGGCP